ncbi:MAG: GIY-YIG nuclease family protein [Gammaproteobacteria bacterium]
MSTINHTEKSIGFVYILEVSDIILPVCKIGMTTRTPLERCEEINKSSTGDFIWSVAYFIYVDDCKNLEKLIHSKLEPLRQRRREFFNIDAENANKALISIFKSQSEIKKIDYQEPNNQQPKIHKKRKPLSAHIKPEHMEILHSFTTLLKVKGRPFGQSNKTVFGISDGNKGVQWNLGIWSSTSDIKLGVNLEGSQKTGLWLITPFILSEMKSPSIEAVKTKVNTNLNDITIKFSRDAWQGASRLNITEKYIGGRKFSLSEIDEKLWKSILAEALTCLNEENKYRGRKRKQLVTLENGNKKVEKDISPHLTIQVKIKNDENIINNLQKGIEILQPIYHWVNERCGVKKASGDSIRSSH